MGTIKRILLAADGSDHALHAAAFSGMLSRETGANVDIVTVHNDNAVMLTAMGPATVPYSALSADEIRRTVEQHATDTTLPDTVKASGEGARIGATVHICGQVSEQTCAYADGHACHLIVRGTRGRSNFSKLLLGRVSTQVTSHADCPVTLVR